MEKDRVMIKKKVANIYDESARVYHFNHYISGKRYSPLKYRQHYIENMIKMQNISKHSRILDVGCGPGELIVNLLKDGYDVWGVDISRQMIEEAIKTVQGNDFPKWNHASVGDIECIDFPDGFFDVVVAAGVIEYQKDDEKSLLEMKRVLKKDGFIILNVTNKYSYIGMLNGIYSRVKKNVVTRSMIEFIKDRLLHKDNVSNRPSIPDKRVHSPRAFDRQMAVYGFEKIRYNYFHFSIFPKPFDYFLGFINETISKKMEAFTNTKLGILGGGYIVMARNIK